MLALCRRFAWELAAGEGLRHTAFSWPGLSAGGPLFLSVWPLQQKAWASYMVVAAFKRASLTVQALNKSLTFSTFAEVPLAKESHVTMLKVNVRVKLSKRMDSGRHDPWKGH